MRPECGGNCPGALLAGCRRVIADFTSRWVFVITASSLEGLLPSISAGILLGVSS
jgi:hypothetical protein